MVFLGGIQQNIISAQCPSNQTIKLLKYFLRKYSESFDVWRNIGDVKHPQDYENVID